MCNYFFSAGPSGAGQFRDGVSGRVAEEWGCGLRDVKRIKRRDDAMKASPRRTWCGGGNRWSIFPRIFVCSHRPDDQFLQVLGCCWTGDTNPSRLAPSAPRFR